MAEQIVTAIEYPNFSGLLFNNGNTKTPFSTMIAGRSLYTNHREFTTGQYFTTADGTQPAISETASLTAPDAVAYKRAQDKNVTQIFQKSIYVTYRKMSNMGSLSGINIANQQPNPTDELAFQAAAAMNAIAQDVEYTFINGEYQESTGTTVADKSKGIVNAITTNTIDAKSKELNYWMLVEAMEKVAEANGDATSLVALLNGTQLMQVQKDARVNGCQIIQQGSNINGINITQIVSPYGVLKLTLGKYIPAGTALIVNPEVCAPVLQPVPDKGNFFLEPLAKTGAGSKYQIFGQAGLDYGPEWYHAKITGLSTTFTPPEDGILTRTAAAAAG